MLIKNFLNPKWPNIIIGADTLRADHVHYYGYDRATSPTIDKLAQEGVVFSEAFSLIPATTSSFATILTSKRSTSHGILCNNYDGYSLEERHITLAELLKNKGYETAAFMSGFTLKRNSGLTQGFDVYDDQFRGPERKAADVMKKFFEWMDGNKDDKFFVFMHYFDPHGKYKPPAPYNSLFPYTKKEFDISRIPKYQRHGDISDPSFYISQYDGEIKYVDDHIAKLLEKLSNLGIKEETLIIFTSDHGETLDEHTWWFEHGHNIYDEQIHVPLIFWYPKLFKHRKNDALVTQLSVVPTVLDILGINFKNGLEGRSLLGVILGKKWSDDDFVYAESNHGNPRIRDQDELSGVESKLFTVRSKEWKLIKIPKTAGIYYELYNLKEDPKETRNLIGQDLEIEAVLREKLDRFVQEYKSSPAYLKRIKRKFKRKRDTQEDMQALRSLGYLQ